jgi:hypothetical protein
VVGKRGFQFSIIRIYIVYYSIEREKSNKTNDKKIERERKKERKKRIH